MYLKIKVYISRKSLFFCFSFFERYTEFLNQIIKHIQLTTFRNCQKIWTNGKTLEEITYICVCLYVSVCACVFIYIFFLFSRTYFPGVGRHLKASKFISDFQYYRWFLAIFKTILLSMSETTDLAVLHLRSCGKKIQPILKPKLNRGTHCIIVSRFIAHQLKINKSIVFQIFKN